MNLRFRSFCETKHHDSPIRRDQDYREDTSLQNKVSEERRQYEQRYGYALSCNNNATLLSYKTAMFFMKVIRHLVRKKH